jgi:hypothetical protein
MTMKTDVETALAPFSDDELVSKSISGSRDAFGQIVTRYRGWFARWPTARRRAALRSDSCFAWFEAICWAPFLLLIWQAKRIRQAFRREEGRS